MKSFILLLAVAAIGSSNAQDIDTGDYPAACQQYCGPVAARSSACNADTDDSDDSEVSCLCSGSGMSNAIPRCDACVAPFRIPGEDDFEDIQEVLQLCGFATTSLSSAPTPTTTYVFTTTSTDDDGDIEVETITSFGAPTPTGVGTLITSVYTTTSTDDDGDIETEVETTTFFSAAASASSTFVITTTSNGETLTRTRVANPTGVVAASSSSTSDNGAMRTSVPLLGAAAIAVGALAAL